MAQDCVELFKDYFRFEFWSYLILKYIIINILKYFETYVVVQLPQGTHSNSCD